MDQATNGRNVVMGLVVTTGRIGATTARLALFPARVVARSPFAEPFRGRLAETSRSTEVAARSRLETVAGDVLTTLWGVKTSVPPAKQVDPGAREEFLHPTGRSSHPPLRDG